MTPREAFALIRRQLEAYVFRPASEAEMQEQVASVLNEDRWFVVEREVRSAAGRFDLMVRCDGVAVVLELKLRWSVAAVERQAQRYARAAGVDAVMVVTTSRRLERQLADLAELGGKPFAAVALRSM